MKKENLKTRLSNLKAEIAEIEKELEQPEEFDFKKALEEAGHEWCITTDGRLLGLDVTDPNIFVRRNLFLQGNTFKTREEAEKESERREVTTMLKILAGDQSWVDWDNEEQKRWILGVGNGQTVWQNVDGPEWHPILLAHKKPYSFFKTTEELKKATSIIGAARIVNALS